MGTCELSKQADKAKGKDMNVLTGVFCCFCFGYGLTSGQPWLVIVAAILGYFVAMACGEEITE